MKKYILMSFFLLGFSTIIMAQETKVSSVQINGKSQPCVAANYMISADLVEAALRKKFSDLKLGSGSKASDGYRLYKGVVMSDLASEKMDIYFKVEDRKPSSTVYMLTSKGYDNFMTMSTDSVVVTKTISFLDHFVKDATAYRLNTEIEKQNNTMGDTEKRIKNNLKDGENLAKKKKKLESKISENVIETGAKKNEAENEQRALEQVKVKTATIEGVSDLKKEVGKQESVTKKATNNFESAVKDGAEYAEDLAKTEKEIEVNKNEQEALKILMEADKLKLQELKTQLRDVK